MKSRLPTGIQTFRKVREGGYRYVDKTPWARQMIDEGECFFLSRPRRFGKSLFLSMLGELFRGSEDLFEGLAIHRHWNWSESHPVLRLSFGSGEYKKPDAVRLDALAQLEDFAEEASVSLRHNTAPGRLRELLRALHRRSKRGVVVLVDEYDKPIMDALEVPEVARANRDFLRGLYGTIKDCDDYVRFAFITGVSRFTKVSLFSGLNNIKDITLVPRYSSICGYTEADLDETFSEELTGLDRERIREWYNGYNWLGEERLYNPHEVLLLLQRREFKSWWYATGTPAFLPTFLAKELLRPGAPPPSLEDTVIEEDRMEAFDVDRIEPEVLLFQTGYLTIVGQQDWPGQVRYCMDYPNRSVRESFSRTLVNELTRGTFKEPKTGPSPCSGRTTSRA